MSALSGTTGSVLFDLEGTELENLFGRAVCSIGDADGDGFEDFVVGAPHDDAAALNGGRLLVYRGSVTDQCKLKTVGQLNAGAWVSLRVMACPRAPLLLLADVSPGPVPIPPYGQAMLGFTSSLLPLADTVGWLGPPVGGPVDTQGLFEAGPWLIDASWTGATIYLQAFVFDVHAPNGLFQRSSGLGVTFLP